MELVEICFHTSKHCLFGRFHLYANLINIVFRRNVPVNKINYCALVCAPYYSNKFRVMEQRANRPFVIVPSSTPSYVLRLKKLGFNPVSPRRVLFYLYEDVAL